VLTGWIGGPEATALLGEGDEKIYQTAIQSLSYIFSLEPAYLESEILEYKIADWADDEFSAGAYSYATVEGRSAVNYFNSSFTNTMYFAGEHLNPEYSFGTVEAAFLSARHSVNRIRGLKD
jgi:monoamine oxidase